MCEEEDINKSDTLNINDILEPTAQEIALEFIKRNISSSDISSCDVIEVSRELRDGTEYNPIPLSQEKYENIIKEVELMEKTGFEINNSTHEKLIKDLVVDKGSANITLSDEEISWFNTIYHCVPNNAAEALKMINGEITDIGFILHKSDPSQDITSTVPYCGEKKPDYATKFHAMIHTFFASADRFNQGKPQWHLMNYEAMEPMLKVLEFGAKKYGERNWMKGLSPQGVLDSLQRHVAALMDGKTIDEESGLPIIGHVMANAMFYSFFTINRKEDTGFCDGKLGLTK